MLGDQNRENSVQMQYKNMFPYERTLCLRLSQELHLLRLCCCSSPELQKNPQALPPYQPLKTSHPSKPCMDHPLLFRTNGRWEELFYLFLIHAAKVGKGQEKQSRQAQENFSKDC